MRVNGEFVKESDLPGYSEAEALRRKAFEKSLSVAQKFFIICEISKEAGLRRQKQVRDRMAETGMSCEEAIRSFWDEWKNNPAD